MLGQSKKTLLYVDSNCLFSLIVSVFLLILSTNVIAQSKQTKSEQSYQKSIGEIGNKIKSISQNLNANKTLLKSERDQLFKTEQAIAVLAKKLEKTNYELAKNEHELDALRIRIERLHNAQTSNRAALSKLITARFKNGKPDYLKNVLNQKNPYAVGRLNNYHGYFSKALKLRYVELSSLAEEAFQLELSQSAVIAKLAKDKVEQTKLKEQQQTTKKRRAATIAKLDTKVANSAQQLDKLKKDRERLKSLLAQLKKQAANLKRIEEKRAKERARELAKQNKPTTPSKPIARKLVKGGFVKQKGRLSYPVSGTAKRKFGVRLPESGMRAEGHFFDTKTSVSVKSIFRGRVLFADFLKGYGQLIIIDHGDDHISLYGHNNRILKQVGDTVETNEIIAKSGVTGGLKSPGLYFEIRNNATPIDPAKWCR